MRNIICFVFGHKYKLFRKINKHISELQCKRCHKYFGINTDVKALLPLDNELFEMHNDILRCNTHK